MSRALSSLSSRSRPAHVLGRWLEEAKASGIKELQSLASGIYRDFDAVRAALATGYSNGQTEGKVNKLKCIKRQMYGRANFDLLRQRMLLCESETEPLQPQFTLPSQAALEIYL